MGNIVGNIVRTSLLCKRIAFLALLLLASGQPALAGSAPPGVAAVQPPIHLAWDRVGSPIQIRA